MPRLPTQFAFGERLILGDDFSATAANVAGSAGNKNIHEWIVEGFAAEIRIDLGYQSILSQAVLCER